MKRLRRLHTAFARVIALVLCVLVATLLLKPCCQYEIDEASDREAATHASAGAQHVHIAGTQRGHIAGGDRVHSAKSAHRHAGESGDRRPPSFCPDDLVSLKTESGSGASMAGIAVTSMHVALLADYRATGGKLYPSPALVVPPSPPPSRRLSVLLTYRRLLL